MCWGVRAWRRALGALVGMGPMRRRRGTQAETAMAPKLVGSGTEDPLTSSEDGPVGGFGHEYARDVKKSFDIG